MAKYRGLWAQKTGSGRWAFVHVQEIFGTDGFDTLAEAMAAVDELGKISLPGR